MVIQYKEWNPLNCFISEELKNLPHFDPIFWGRIPSKSLTLLRFFARMGSYNRILFHPIRIIFRQTFPPCLRLTNKLKNRQYFYFLKFIMESLRLFTQKEVCSLFQISKTKLYRDIAAGLFPRPITIGKTSVRWRYID